MRPFAIDSGRVTMRDITIRGGSTGPSGGGGIYSAAGSVTLRNSIKAKSGGGGCLLGGGSAVGSHTLIERTGSADCDLVNGMGGNYNLTAPRSW